MNICDAIVILNMYFLSILHFVFDEVSGVEDLSPVTRKFRVIVYISKITIKTLHSAPLNTLA